MGQPIRIGISGHRKLRPEDIEALSEAVREELKKLKKAYPHTPLELLCSLAEGGDLLCADAAEELGIPVHAILPMEIVEYEKDFTSAGLERLHHHLDAAAEVIIPAFTENEPETMKPEFLYRQAGIYVSAHTDILIALWDGAPGLYGCGTAEAVDFTLKADYQPADGVKPTEPKGVIHIFTPRGDHTEELAGTRHYLGDWEVLRARLKALDAQNTYVS